MYREILSDEKDSKDVSDVVDAYRSGYIKGYSDAIKAIDGYVSVDKKHKKP